MEEKAKFLKNVLVVDVNLLNGFVGDARKVLSERVGRELPKIDLAGWLELLCLDAGLRGEDNEVQVLLVHEQGVEILTACQPGRLSELSGNACRLALGEMQFTAVNPAGMAPASELFVDLMTLAIDAEETEKVLLVPFQPVYGELVEERVKRIIKEKGSESCQKVLYFVMSPLQSEPAVRTDLITFSLLQTWGIQPDELK